MNKNKGRKNKDMSEESEEHEATVEEVDTRSQAMLFESVTRMMKEQSLMLERLQRE